MLTQEGLDFILRITDYFHGHWEDPSWGRRGINQVLILLSIYNLAEGIADTEARQTVQRSVERAMANAAEEIVKTSSTDSVPSHSRK
jgi:hypothetical protein